MKSQIKIRRLIGVIIAGVLLFTGGYLPDAKAETGLASTEEAMSDIELFRKIERQEASVPPLQVWNLASLEVNGAKLNWAIAEMGKAVFATVQGEAASPISGDAIHIIQSSLGFGAFDDFRLATTLLESETGQPMAQLLPASVTVASSGSAGNVSEGWGGFAEFGLFAVTGFVFSMWILAGEAMRNKPPMKGEEEEAVAEYAEYREAA